MLQAKHIICYYYFANENSNTTLLHMEIETKQKYTVSLCYLLDKWVTAFGGEFALALGTDKT